MTAKLRAGQARLETTTKVALGVLAVASGVYTYLGVRGLLDGDASLVFFGAAIYSVAVSVGIYTFWSYLIRFLPHVESAAARGWLFLSMALGSAMIIAMSSWLNAAALAGSAALEQHMANATETYQERLDQAHSNALAAQSLLPDIQLAAQRFAALSGQERDSGALTGTSGSGTVAQLLEQTSRELERLAAEVRDSREAVKQRFEAGGKNLARMRELTSRPGPVDARANAFGEEALALIGEIAALEQTSVAPAVRRAAEDLETTFIAPIADGGSVSLQARQTEIVGRVEAAVRAQSQALARAADEILNRAPVVAPRFEPLSQAEAVLRYAGFFLPSWAGAISIDLLPGVLIFIMIVVEGAIRRGESAEADAETLSAADVIRAAAIYRRMERELGPLSRADAPDAGPAAPQAPSARTSESGGAAPSGRVVELGEKKP